MAESANFFVQFPPSRAEYKYSRCPRKPLLTMTCPDLFIAESPGRPPPLGAAPLRQYRKLTHLVERSIANLKMAEWTHYSPLDPEYQDLIAKMFGPQSQAGAQTFAESFSRYVAAVRATSASSDEADAGEG